MKDKQMTWEQAVEWLKDQPDQIELVRHCYYDDPLTSAAERFEKSEEWSAVQKLIAHHFPAKILDLGAGRGISSYAFAKAGCSVTALEPDQSNLVGSGAIRSLFSAANLPITIAEEFAETLPFEECIFNIVYGRAVLHHAQDLKKFCLEISRVLKKGGILLATREHVIDKKSDLENFFNSHALHHLYGGENAYLLREYLEAMKEAGLEIQNIMYPYDNVINYTPLTIAEFEDRVRQRLSKLLGKMIARRISKHEIVKKFYGRLLPSFPGNLFSFIAIKR